LGEKAKESKVVKSNCRLGAAVQGTTVGSTTLPVHTMVLKKKEKRVKDLKGDRGISSERASGKKKVEKRVEQ